MSDFLDNLFGPNAGLTILGEDRFRLAVENEIMDGIAETRRLFPDLIPQDAEARALASLQIYPRVPLTTNRR
jgi:hypothetical protein